MSIDVVVIGAGLVGAAIGYGLASRGARILVIDGDDHDFRAAQANGALVWLQGKGLGMPAYHQLTSASVDLWPDFARSLFDATAIDVQYERNGGLWPCLGEAEFEQRRETMLRWRNQLGGAEPDSEMLDREAAQKLFPKAEFGPEVTGASFGRRDGYCNPIRLLPALHAGILKRGGRLRGGVPVRALRGNAGGGFTVEFGSERVSAERVVIAAGLGSEALGAQVGLDVPIRPQRGQMLVTERLEPLLPLPMPGLRQMREGTVVIGVTTEETGFDNSTTVQGAASLCANAVRRIPALRDAVVVRQWAGLRVMTPDGHPIYAESESHPGAFVALCHSGVTLAATHAVAFPEAILAGKLPSAFEPFHHRRFNVSQAA